MELFGLDATALEKAGASWTAREIAQQPRLWQHIAAVLDARAPARARLASWMQDSRLRIILTGAGSSAFIGECLAPSLLRQCQHEVLAVSTTDLVAGPGNWLLPQVPTLLVSFARSGNSPESLAALDCVQQVVRTCHHLVITCNAQGALCQRAQGMANAQVVLLPDECNDRSFAMTSSFSGMLLAAALLFNLLPGGVGDAAAGAQAVFDDALPLARALAAGRFERVIFLGANALKALAREAALKLLELTDGRVAALADTPLGFRHGPKTIVNARTLVVLFVSGDAHARRYDLDLLGELRRDGVAARVLAVAAQPTALAADDFLVPGSGSATDIGLCFPYVAFAQCLALLQSLSLGITPDNPNPSGTVNRVVRGVSIYPLEDPR